MKRGVACLLCLSVAVHAAPDNILGSHPSAVTERTLLEALVRQTQQLSVLIDEAETRQGDPRIMDYDRLRGDLARIVDGLEAAVDARSVYFVPGRERPQGGYVCTRSF